MDVRLRGLLPEDRPALQAILAGTPEFTDAEAAVAVELIDDRLGGGEHYRFVVADGPAGVAGYACFGPAPMTDGVWDLYWLVVDQARRGDGVGAALLRETERIAAAQDARMLLIETASKPEYAGTRRFYERSGYAETARVADYYRAGDDKIVYRKPLRRVSGAP